MWVTAGLHTLDISTVTLPIEIGLDSFPEPQDYIRTGIGAGKLKDQKHPR